MSRYSYYASHFLDSRWGRTRSLNLSSFNNPQTEITITLPPEKYFTSRTKKPLITSFYIYKKIESTTTPMGVFGRITELNDNPAGGLFEYKEGNNTWLLSKEICLLNNTIVFLSLPTIPKTLVIGMGLMKINSRLAKFIKEKILPEIDIDRIHIEFRDTSNYRRAKYLQGPITPELIEELLLTELT